ncbi:ribonuclease Y [Candidatus Bathyarchaeota archaeon]|jgi:ribonucrease Y|nr:ribonuclease Y [Candidatus Bathyarchaeota archaeon]
MSTLLNSLLTTFNKPVGKDLKKPSKLKSLKKQPKPKKTKPQQDPALINQAQETAREIIAFAREEADKIRAQVKHDSEANRQSLQDFQAKLNTQSQDLTTRTSSLDSKEQAIADKNAKLDQLQQEVADVKKSQVEKLEKIASLTRAKAKEILLEAVDKKITRDVADRLRVAEDEYKQGSDDKARELLVDSMYHGATDYVPEYTVSTVKIPSDDVKGRIIGKDGRNIKAFEKFTGVDIDMDETPGEVRLSSFHSVRREIARVALERLIKDGRIQPTRIEEYVAKSRREIEKVMYEEGKKLCHAVSAFNVPTDLIALLGRFKFRSSYGQNMILHTLEETKIGMKLAEEAGANVEIVRMGCLFHDIGKVLEEEGSHVELGVKILKKYNIDQRIINTVAEHHEDEEYTSQESIIVYIADAISGSRPGARYENYDEYVTRLTAIEDIAKSYKGVVHAFAIQAGREVRVILDPSQASDDDAMRMASDIRDEIKEKLTYPGTVTVNVIRETRATQVAK